MKKLIFCFLLSSIFFIFSCKESFLDEKPLGFLNTDIVLVDENGFESAITSLHEAMRSENTGDDLAGYFSMQLGTDVATTGVSGLPDFRNYSITITPIWKGVTNYWNWAYLRVFPRANTIIEYAQNPDVKWSTPGKKEQIIAEARFMRAYAYNILANLFGGVPIVDKVQKEPKIDYVKASREQVLEFVKEDLIYASQYLPELTNIDGRIVKAAADHLLCEVYISLGEYPKAIESASKVIDSGLYHLMTERFGSATDKPGNVFSDLFKDNNQNRSSGNKEMIWCWQIEYLTPGGGTNNWIRKWGSRWWAIKDPDKKAGMILTDSLGRGVGQCRPNSLVLYDVWKDNWDNDIRNSEYCIKRNWYYNNPESKYFGQKVDFNTAVFDSMMTFPQIMKVAATFREGGMSAVTYTEVPIMRLAETYLLRAEAYLMNGNKKEAAADINVVRARAHAKPVQAKDVDLDYILDERIRELVIEEPRRRTLVRTGKLFERVKKYNIRKDTRETIEEYHRWWPIPQYVIDANYGQKLEQNPGY